MISCSLALLVFSQLALAAVTPIAPGPGEAFTASSECSISWATDQSGKWKSFSIDLMSGSNSNMTLVTNVAEDLDGTDPSLSPYTWTCPEVDPYSAVYFYQFNNAADKSNPAWTTRFTITSSAGETTTPPHSKQPSGDKIPWGVGVLRSGSPMASREKHSEKTSTEELDLNEDDGNDGDESTGQRPSDEVEGGTSDDDSEGTPVTGPSSGKSSSVDNGMSNKDPDEFEVSENGETATGSKSKSSKPSLKDTEGDSKVLNATDSKNGGIDGSLAIDEDEDGESKLENTVSTSSRMMTIHSKPTPTPFSADNLNAATPTIPLPSATLLSAQPVGCAGGINATSSYCSTSASANHATHISKLSSRAFLATTFIYLFTLL